MTKPDPVDLSALIRSLAGREATKEDVAALRDLLNAFITTTARHTELRAAVALLVQLSPQISSSEWWAAYERVAELSK